MLDWANRVWVFAVGLSLIFRATICDAADHEGTEIPLEGNGYITKSANEEDKEDIDYAIISFSGLQVWNSNETVVSVYFKFATRQVFQVALRVMPYGLSQIQVTIGTKQVNVTIKGNKPYNQSVGAFAAPPGYIKVDLQGISKTGDYYADVEALVLHNVIGNIVYVKNEFATFRNRRGPTLYLNYRPKTTKPIEYFYNEVFVPKDQDIYGCYFMVAGFADGYFGFQRIHPEFKLILFDVRPVDNTDKNRVRLLKMDPNVKRDGQGGSAGLEYDWRTETKYKFLVFGAPTPDGKGTNYTGWFKAPDPAKWRLVASFMKPKVAHNLDNLYSFSENFVEKQGHITRKVLFGNQWVRTSDGKWHEVTKALFTGDAESTAGREDYAAGLDWDPTMFYLKSTGFFNEKVDTNEEFTRLKTNQVPTVNITALP